MFFSFVNIIFTDLPEIMESDAPWLAWEAAAAENPTVVNTSVSSLANLFFDLPDVMDHMQKTIDFYIKNGQAPTLEELKGLHKSLDHPYPLVPGLQVSVVTAYVVTIITYWQLILVLLVLLRPYRLIQHLEVLNNFFNDSFTLGKLFIF